MIRLPNKRSYKRRLLDQILKKRQKKRSKSTLLRRLKSGQKRGKMLMQLLGKTIPTSQISRK